MAALLILATCRDPSSAGTLPVVRANDNRTPAGVVENGVVTLRLVAQRARWYPGADSGPHLTVAAFAAEGAAPTIPGPLLRVRPGTRVRLWVRNALTDTLVLCTPMRVACAERDTVRIAPGGNASAEFVASGPPTSSYRALYLRGGKVTGRPDAEDLMGAIVVDSAENGDIRERLLVLNSWNDSTDETRFVQMINGRTWPHTERFDLTMGDSIRWRLLNAGGTEHPMHLHGFYFRVDARGNVEQDTVFTDDQRQLVVTENLRAFGTATIAWAPTRSGNWLFHCHKAAHMSANQQVVLAGLPIPDTLTAHSGAQHAAEGMGGLVIGIRVAGAPPTAGAREPTAARRIRLLIQENARHYGNKPAFGFVVDDGDAHPAADSVEIPGPMLALTRDEPVEIAVVNRLRSPTTVHWHGIELESYYDGVGGWSGAAQSLAPLIAPSDSFVARFTPPRSGTFMYHAHVSELRVLASGLYAPLLVVDRGRRRDPTVDHVLLFSQDGPDTTALVAVNGRTPSDTVRMAAGVVNRLRFINITAMDEVDGTLGPGTAGLTWREVAKDGADLHPSRTQPRSANVHLGPGETLDVEVTLRRGDYHLSIKSFNNFDVPIRVR